MNGPGMSRAAVHPPSPIPLPRVVDVLSTPLPDLRDVLQRTLGDAYLIERELPGGGMSRLFLATERALKRPVVIKLLPRELTSEVSAARFRREIELAAQLRHPNILPVLNAGTRDGLLYYVMPYVPGESLRQRLVRERRMSTAEALRLLREASDALAYAHHSGVVHRDVKPENILLEQGHAVLADFGIARGALFGKEDGPDRLTVSGVSIGTPGYMAPEQAAGERQVDARADVYALAVVGYEMLAGRTPFEGATAQAMLAAQLTEAPTPLASLCPDAPPGAVRAIHRALERAPEARFRTAAEFRDVLDASFAEEAGGGASGGRRRGTGTALAALVGEGLSAARRLLRGAFGEPAEPATSGTPSQQLVLALNSPVCNVDSTVAVLPFAVHGTDRLAYLGEGMVDLLSAKLDGAGGLCTADPRAVLGLIAQEGGAVAAGRAPDPAQARAIAQRVNAGRFVLGSLVEAGGRLQASATLYATDGGAWEATARATADEEAQLFELVDELAIQLLAGRDVRQQRATAATAGGVAGGGGPGLATSTTHRLPALRAYLDGERLFRAGQFTLAVDAFRSAVEEDPTFALAWYRLSLAAEWSGHRGMQEAAAEQALKHGGRLSEYDRRHLAAFVAWRHGDPAAESMYRDLVTVRPNDVEAWFQLGEVLFHLGPLCGRPIAESRTAWERVLAFEPEHVGALHHLARIAAVEGRRTDLDDLTRRLLRVSPDGERAIEMTALHAFTAGDAEEQRRAAEGLRASSDATLIITVRTVAAYSGNLPGAARLAQLLTEPSRAASVRALGHIQCAYLEVARGRWGAARDHLDAAEPLDEAAALAARGLMLSLPFPPAPAVPRAVLEAARDRLTSWDADAVASPPGDSPSMFVRIHHGVYPHLRAYVLGVLHVRLGDFAAAHRYATELEGCAATAQHREALLPRGLSEGVRAHMAAARGDHASALAILERSTVSMSYDLPLASPFYSRSAERFLRACLVAENPVRAEEAARWYNSFGETSVYDLIFLAPSHLRRAELFERAGDRVRAAGHYKKFVSLWKVADVELRPVVAGAARRAAADARDARPQ